MCEESIIFEMYISGKSHIDLSDAYMIFTENSIKAVKEVLNELGVQYTCKTCN